MEMCLDPGWDRTIINLRGPCTLDVTKDGNSIAVVEVPSGEVYKLVVTRRDAKPDYLVAEATNVIAER